VVPTGKTFVIFSYYWLDILADTAFQAEVIIQGDLSGGTCGCNFGNHRTAIKYFTGIILFDMCFTNVRDSRLSLPYQAAMVIFFRCDYRGFRSFGL